MQNKALIKLLLILAAVDATAAEFEASGSDWVRQVADETDTRTALTIVTISSHLGELSGLATYRWIGSNGPIIVQGRRDSYGNFWPAATYEVSIDGGKKWRTIGGYEPELLATEQFDTQNPKGLLKLDMEPFRASIGKFRFGRVRLSNGETAELSLDDLLPPPEKKGTARNFTKEVTDLDPRRFGSLFALVAITSFSGDLVGDFVFAGPEGTYAEVRGLKKENGEFWPVVIFQCGNGDDKWETVGKSKNDTATTLIRLSSRAPLVSVRVPLNIYRNHAERCKFGRLIFSDSEIAAVFQLSDLPPFSK